MWERRSFPPLPSAAPPLAAEQERLAYSVQEAAGLLGVDYFSIYRLPVTERGVTTFLARCEGDVFARGDSRVSPEGQTAARSVR